MKNYKLPIRVEGHTNWFACSVCKKEFTHFSATLHKDSVCDECGDWCELCRKPMEEREGKILAPNMHLMCCYECRGTKEDIIINLKSN